MEFNFVNITAAVFSLAILGSLIRSMLMKKERSEQERLFLLVLILHVLNTAGVLLACAVAGQPGELALTLAMVGNFMTSFIGAMAFPAFLIKVHSHITGGAPLTYAGRALSGLVAVLAVLSLALAFANIWTGSLYSIDAQNTLHIGARGTLMDKLALAQVAALLLLLLITPGEGGRPAAMKGFLLYCAIPAAAILLENRWPELMLLTPSVAISLLLLYMDGQRQQERKMLMQELALSSSRSAIVLSQVQPHFMYNVLNTIYHMCEKDPEIAQKAIGDFADYLRGNLDTLNHNTTVPFEMELRQVNTYLELEKLRYDDMLKVEMDIHTVAFMLPVLTVQPLVENAVKHGLGEKAGGGTLRLSTREFEDRFEVRIQDDGVGFDPAQPPPDDRYHTGIDNVRQRLWSMSRGTLKVISEPGKGTLAVIAIPKSKDGRKGD